MQKGYAQRACKRFTFILSVCFILFGQTVFGQCLTPVSLSTTYLQGFNSSSLPACWTQQYVFSNANVFPTSSLFYEGAYSISFGSTYGNSTRLVSPLLSSSGVASVYLEFYWLNSHNGGFSSYPNEGLQIQYSTDGLVWTNAGSFIKRHDDALNPYTSQWKRKVVALPIEAGQQSALYIGFKFEGQGGEGMYLDKLAITNFNPDCPQSINLQYFSYCNFNQVVNGTRTELKVMNTSYSDVTYATTTSAGTPVGGNTTGSTGQGNGSGLSVGFISTSGTYQVTATKTDCPTTSSNVSIYVPTVSTQPSLVQSGVVCSGDPYSNVLLLNSESGVTYRLVNNGSPIGSERSGNGSTIDFGSQYNSGNYSVNAWACGSPTYNFGNLTLSETLPVPATEGFNSFDPKCWSQQDVVNSSSISFTSSSANPITSPQEGAGYAFYNSKTINDGTEKRLVTPKLSSLNSAFVNVEFYWFNENNTTYASLLQEGMQVQYSFNGTTWLNAGSFITRHDGTLASGTGQWKKKKVTLPIAAGNQATLYIGFKFHSGGGDNMSMDNVEITYSMFPLPIDFLSFDAKRISGDVQLNWKVSCTTNFPDIRFDVERSMDGRNFNVIDHKIIASSTCSQAFSYLDKTAVNGINYYRVKYTETDGKVAYSKILFVLNRERGFELSSLLPNLVRNSTILHITAANKTNISLIVYDMQGRAVQKFNKTFDAGSNKMNLDFGNLPAGTYSIHGNTTDGETGSIVFIKQ
jgi:hypothetical protein